MFGLMCHVWAKVSPNNAMPAINKKLEKTRRGNMPNTKSDWTSYRTPSWWRLPHPFQCCASQVLLWHSQQPPEKRHRAKTERLMTRNALTPAAYLLTYRHFWSQLFAGQQPSCGFEAQIASGETVTQLKPCGDLNINRRFETSKTMANEVVAGAIAGEMKELDRPHLSLKIWLS